jgi:hypothetical protein
MFKWFKEEEQEKAKKNEDLIVNAETIKISYKGRHVFHVGSETYDSFKHKSSIRLYMKGEGIAKFSVGGNDYNLEIQPFVYLEDFETKSQLYIGACEMDRDFIVEELKKDVVEKIELRLRYMEEDELRRVFENQKMTFEINFDINRNDFLKQV